MTRSNDRSASSGSRRLRVLLVQAPSVEGPRSEIVAPLGLACVAARAREGGHEVEVLDLNLHFDAASVLEAALRSGDHDVVGLGLRNIDPLANRRHSYLPAFAAVIDTVRRVRPDVPLVVGGAGYSMFPRVILERYPALDIGVVREGEVTFPAILEKLAERGASRAAVAVAGLPGTIARVGAASEGDGGLVEGPARPLVTAADLDAPRPWLPELAAEYRGRASYAPEAGIETKRGCPLRCSYCVYPSLQGRRLRVRSPRVIVEEVERVVREGGSEWVHFTDPVLNLPPEHFRDVCRLLIERGAPARWTGFFREDTLTAADARLAVRAGCAAFQFSGDGTCDRTLASLRKGLRLDDILGAARAVADTDALAVYHFMANVPDTDARIAADAHRLVARLHDTHAHRGNLGAIVFNNLRVYPGTALAADLKACAGPLGDAALLHPLYHDPEPFHDLRYDLEETHRVLASQSSTWHTLGSGPADGGAAHTKATV